ncbi:hypothetical protein KCP76_23855 [Salmonella enterica subsp. enterica serovar Weltevreden]|nr:hypothetical protein KCP76_23855 [Salmonella enterica subsp. enterica serovar Weltevreden]
MRWRKRLHLPGFGDCAITDPQAFPPTKAQLIYLRVAANIAFMGKTPVALGKSGRYFAVGAAYLPAIQHTLKADETGPRGVFLSTRVASVWPEDSGYTEQTVRQRVENPYRSGMQMSPPTVTPSSGSVSAAARSGIRRVCQMVARD